MAIRQIEATECLRIPITRVDHGLKGAVVYRVTSNNPQQLRAELGATADGSPAVVVTPLVRAADKVSFKVEDDKGSKPAVGELSIVTSASVIGLGISEAEVFTQELPKAAPAPTPAAPVVPPKPPVPPAPPTPPVAA